MNILTFDIEDWYHLLDTPAAGTPASWMRREVRIHQNTDRILDLLSARGQFATFFCVGWIARTHPDVVKRISGLGHEIGSHSDLHKLVYAQSRDAFERDLERSVKSVEDLTGEKVVSYRAPGFSLGSDCAWAFEVLGALGIERDCSVFPARRAHGGFQGFLAAEPCFVNAGGVTLKEFPVNVFPVLGLRLVFSGGGYFRMIPFFMISYMMNRSPYVMTYFHPRDFDPTQPVLSGLPLQRRFKSYVGLSSAYAKLERLIREWDFVDLRTADRGIDWTKAKAVRL